MINLDTDEVKRQVGRRQKSINVLSVRIKKAEKDIKEADEENLTQRLIILEGFKKEMENEEKILLFAERPKHEADLYECRLRALILKFKNAIKGIEEKVDNEEFCCLFIKVKQILSKDERDLIIFCVADEQSLSNDTKRLITEEVVKDTDLAFEVTNKCLNNYEPQEVHN